MTSAETSPEPLPKGAQVDLLVAGATLVATVDDDRRELAGGWVAVTGGLVSGVGGPRTEPAANRVLRADGCLVTPGLVNTHHHIYQNLTRSHAPATKDTLFGWLTTLYLLWSRLDERPPTSRRGRAWPSWP